MRVILTGTSNSILVNGLRKAFEGDRRITEFVNLSYGASGAIAVGDHMRKVDFRKFDYCLIDYCVNEELLIAGGGAALDDSKNSLAAIVSAASLGGCVPIILNLPSSAMVDVPRPLEAHIHSVFGAAGVPIFDMYAFMNRVVAGHDLERSAFFMDPMHVKRNLARILGTALIDRIAEIADCAPLPLRAFPDHAYRPLGFLAHDMLTLEGDVETVQRASRFTSVDLSAIRPDAVIAFPGGSPRDVVGISFNASRSIGALVGPDGGAPVFRQALSSHFATNRDLSLIGLPLPHPRAIGSDGLRLRYVCDTSLPEDRPPAGFELLGFIVRYTDIERPLMVLPAPERFGDLSSGISSDAMTQILAELRQ